MRCSEHDAWMQFLLSDETISEVDALASSLIHVNVYVLMIRVTF